MGSGFAEQEYGRVPGRDLLDLGRIEAEARMEMTPCDLVEIVEKTVNSLQGPAEYKHQSLTLSCASDLPTVLGNRIRRS